MPASASEIASEGNRAVNFGVAEGFRAPVIPTPAPKHSQSMT
jgi:hypothetical protein